ncbi:MAG: riboflavin kinase, partial [Chitinophagaceae bacterium]
YPYTMEGFVVHGQELGRKIGFPTANMKLLFPEKIIPKKGVYATTIEIEGFENFFSAMTNIGIKPTIVGNHDLSIETNIFNFDEMIYDKKIKVSFHHFIRQEKKFSSLEKLIFQLNIDKQEIIKILS